MKVGGWINMAKGNFTTGAERYNKRANKIFNDYKERRQKEKKMSYTELIADGYSKETAKYIAMENKLKKLAGF
jgi:hypothetical protein